MIICRLSQPTVCVKTALGVFCVVTVEFTADQLHAQRAGPATNHRDNTDILGYNWRVKKVGLGAVIICVAHKNLRHTDTEQWLGWLGGLSVQSSVYDYVK